ncbi:MAG TPA: SDR family NAD(P)-dependent oxidoreductase [Terriglobales bacterium]|nr:SDR family NAD(P)-dependent oxidoreductase [Terriglobales bacterium]
MRSARIFLTGASTGIGRALALEYAAPGRQLGLVARRAELLEEIAAACRGRGAAALALPADVCDGAAMTAAAQRFLDWAGGADLIIANAGGGQKENLLDAAALDQTLRLNVTSVAHTFAPFLPALRTAGGGHLVGVASLAGFRGMPHAPSYGASKAALISYLEALRILVEPMGLRVTTVCPGYVRTPLIANNPFMPWLLEPDVAARIIRRGLERGRSQIVFPWQLGLLIWIMHGLPNRLYDASARAFAARRKERDAG